MRKLSWQTGVKILAVFLVGIAGGVSQETLAHCGGGDGR